MLSWLGGPKRLDNQVAAVAQGFFVPIFFVSLGTKLNVGQVFTDPSLLAAAADLGLRAHALTGGQAAAIVLGGLGTIALSVFAVVLLRAAEQTRSRHSGDDRGRPEPPAPEAAHPLAEEALGKQTPVAAYEARIGDGQPSVLIH